MGRGGGYFKTFPLLPGGSRVIQHLAVRLIGFRESAQGTRVVCGLCFGFSLMYGEKVLQRHASSVCLRTIQGSWIGSK